MYKREKVTSTTQKLVRAVLPPPPSLPGDDHTPVLHLSEPDSNLSVLLPGIICICPHCSVWT